MYNKKPPFEITTSILGKNAGIVELVGQVNAVAEPFCGTYQRKAGYVFENLASVNKSVLTTKMIDGISI